MKKKLLVFIFALIIIFASQSSVLAQAGQAQGPISAPSSSSLFCGSDQINTAIGCISALGSQNAFASQILKWAIGVGSGIAFLLILYGGFMVMSSAGNPDRLKAGQELLTSAISGLLLLVFCVFILNFIGINILGIFS